jgi:hypothetical protein
MKLKALLLMAFISTATFAQDTEFKFSKDGLTDFVVGSFEGSAKDLYKWTLAWVKESKGSKVLSSVENEKITFQGGKENFLCSKAGGTNVCTFGTYTIEITFKDGRYKFDAIELDETDKKGNVTIDNKLTDFSRFYDKDGNLKKYMNDVPAAYEGLFNGLNKNLLTTLEKKKKAENW